MPDEASASKVLVHRPAAGRSERIVAEPGCVYVLNFNEMEASFVVCDHDVHINFDDGGMIILSGFRTASLEKDTVLELLDGTHISGLDLAAALAMTLQDFHTDTAPHHLGAEAGFALFLDSSQARVSGRAGEHDLAHASASQSALPGQAADPEGDGNAGAHSFLVSATVALPHGPLPHAGASLIGEEATSGNTGYFITPHGAQQPPLPGRFEALSGTEGQSPAAPAASVPAPLLFGNHHEVLLLEDLLDISGVVAANEFFPPAFASLFPESGDLFFSAPLPSSPLPLPDFSFSTSPADLQDGSLDALLTVLRLSSF